MFADQSADAERSEQRPRPTTAEIDLPALDARIDG